MPSSLKNLASKIFIYLVAFVLLLSFIVLFVLGLLTRQLRENISGSFKEFGAEVNVVSEEMMIDNVDVFIENYVDMETTAFSYVLKNLKSNLSFISDGISLRYADYDIDKNYYLELIKNHESYTSSKFSSDNNNIIKIFFEKGVDRNNVEVIKDLGIFYDIEDDLILTIIDTLQNRNCYVLSENGVSIFASNYDYNSSPKYAGEELEYRNESWYQKAIATSSILFDGVYKDVLTGRDLVSVRKSIISDNVVRGVIVIEVYVDSLKVNNIGIEPPDGANLFVADRDGKMVYNANSDLYDDNIAMEGTLYQFLEETCSDDNGSGIYTYKGNTYRCFYKRVPDTQFVLYVSIRENKIKEDMNKLQEMILDKNNSTLALIYKTSRNLFIYVLIFALVIITIIFFLAKRVSKSLATPINELSDILNQASKIQKEMLPIEFEKLYARKDIELYAINIPELEVGGDFYNYIIRDNILYLIIADVSGSGMPAAMFMAKTNELLNSAIRLSDSPKVILSYTNIELCKNNMECYFATIGLYCINLKTRKVLYANSGHEDSIIIKSNNEVIQNEEKRSAPSGLNEFNNYEEGEFTLENGDILFLYTDGVVEAINKDKELFGIDRLKNELKNIGSRTPKEIVLDIERKVKDFEAGLEQYDDITMLCFKFKDIDTDETKILKFEKDYKAIYDSVYEVEEFIESCLDKSYNDKDIYEKYLKEISLCIEEIVVNICDYAFAKKNDEGNKFSVKVLIDKNIDRMDIMFIDNGKEFDPTMMHNVNILQGLDKREIGGFGIYITKKIVDILEYNRVDDKNHLTITKYM